MTAPIKIGILGTARIVPVAMIKPISAHSDASIAAIASRDPLKAKDFAHRFHIPKTHLTYAELLQDPAIDAVYIPLPNSLHAEWTLKALEAGKHVLCEKPLAVNADEARAMVQMAQQKQLVLMEAFHYRFHPYINRVKELIMSRELGNIQHITASARLWFFGKNDIRFQYHLGGGALLDFGCYLIDAVHYVTAQTLEVVEAKALLIKDQVDHTMKVRLRSSGGYGVDIDCSLRAMPWQWGISLKISGDRGTLLCLNPLLPQLFNLLRLQTAQSTRYERFKSHLSSYACQLSYFLEAIRQHKTLEFEAAQSIRNLVVIDKAYELAGLKKR